MELVAIRRFGERREHVDAIIELYEAVKQIQEAIWPILLIIPDGIDAARKAAEGQGAIGTSTVKLAPIKRFTR